MRFAIVGLVCLCPLVAQEIKIPASLERLADKASDVVDVTLDASMLQLAARFLSDKDPDSAKVRRLVGGLKGIYVRSFEFDRPGMYQTSDVEAVRSQVHGPNWTRIVGVHSLKSGDHSDIFLKTEGSRITGIMIIAAEPKELTIVSISGSIHPEDLEQLGGHFGIPKIETDGHHQKED